MNRAALKRWIPPAILERHRARLAQRFLREAGATPETARLQLPVRTLAELFPGIENTRLVFDAGGIARPRDMVLPLPEALSLSAIASYLQPHRSFEIGTFTGVSTLALALNAPDAQIWTLDLPDEALQQFAFRFEVGSVWQNAARRDEKLRSHIMQLRGDSRRFDYAPYENQMDLVLVDANHAYDWARDDSRHALQMLAPNGVIIWDDYDWSEHPDCAGVARALHELSREIEIFHLAGTRLAVHRAISKT